jgi:hypothetical protein
MATYSVARLEEIEDLGETADGRSAFRPVRHHFGIRTFGVTATTARRDGDLLITEHEEAEPESGEELYVVMSGHARFEVDGAVEEAPAGTFVHVPAGVRRAAFARDAGTTVLALGGGSEGQVYEPSGWEVFAPLFPLYEAGDYEAAADRAEALLAGDPSLGSAAYYNTACFESLVGRTEPAIEHLRRAVELAPALAELARGDDDLASLREHPAFAEIAGT